MPGKDAPVAAISAQRASISKVTASYGLRVMGRKGFKAFEVIRVDGGARPDDNRLQLPASR